MVSNNGMFWSFSIHANFYSNKSQKINSITLTGGSKVVTDDEKWCRK